MKKYLPRIFIFLTVFWIYFGMATSWSFKPKWALDYFNPLARSLLAGRLNIVNPPISYDLVFVNGKWYAPWGMLPALFLIPIQIIKGRFIPPLYLTLFFAAADVMVFYLLLQRIKREFLPKFTEISLWLVLLLFALGTTHVYVGTLGSVWHVGQMVTNFFGTLSVFFIFKKKRTLKDYFYSICSAGVALLGRATIVLLVLVPAALYARDYLLAGKQRKQGLIGAVFLFGIPLGLFTTVFLTYNWLRFGSIFEYGFRYINESPYLAMIREKNGILSLANLPANIWYMLFEIPRFAWESGLKLHFNLKGNSIFFLTPPLLAIVWANPWKKAEVAALWLAAVVTMIPSLLHYGTGWMQFGYRYTLDITAILVLLSVFGMKGKLNWLYILGIFFSVIVYQMGINALM
ncbi:MAG: hypothetical protein UY16_C0001G0030 [Candidatus Gottesmanbacteria bacterium GW2011_GWA2_47_9]|uniref:Glycosyltransferase RgtA/B/C/D-like domain-containing protein n=2 Tax=Microgenomates group TaxID=1794810 RepID=A0A0G0X4A3_9BACT|nr:MAG: hypothetical protein UU42_C0010G0010 [Candidatus Woesebacteria bacterium GW2011_GWA1_41_13b]KKU88876.1 MAG: hypothetical protein UY16_C0001G0030 [Candidatus Gottesmanbacteria bacterium GW2011_GWA2_47_9]